MIPNPSGWTGVCLFIDHGSLPDDASWWPPGSALSGPHRRDSIKELYEGRDPQAVLRYPPVAIMHETPARRLWFPVPGMYGGFDIQLRDGYLEVASWCRVVGGSGQRHVITEDRTTLVEEGFV